MKLPAPALTHARRQELTRRRASVLAYAALDTALQTGSGVTSRKLRSLQPT